MQKLTPAPTLATVLLRDAQPKDMSAIDVLLRYLVWVHAEARPDLFRYPTDASPCGGNFVANALNDDREKIVVADVGGQVVGFAHLSIRTAPADFAHNERRYAEVEMVVVDPLYQGNGIGRRVIECALRWATSRGVLDHQINAHSFNRGARALYERMGFSPSATILCRKGMST